MDEHPAHRESDAAFEASRLERDRTLEAIHRLEEALGMAAEGDSWAGEVSADLDALEEAMVNEQRELNRPDALLAMIAAAHPRRFHPWIRSLREQYDDLVRQVASLRSQLDHTDGVDPQDLRQRAGWIIRALHHCRARQADLVFEALELDLGER